MSVGRLKTFQGLRVWPQNLPLQSFSGGVVAHTTPLPPLLCPLHPSSPLYQVPWATLPREPGFWRQTVDTGVIHSSLCHLLACDPQTGYHLLSLLPPLWAGVCKRLASQEDHELSKLVKALVPARDVAPTSQQPFLATCSG